MSEKLIKCELCNWTGLQLKEKHLKEKHGITKKQYLENFPNAEFTCKNTRLMISAKAKIRSIENPQSEETKQKIRESMKRVYQETDFPLKKKNSNQEGENNHFFGKAHSQETRTKLSKSTTDWLTDAYRTGQKVSPFTYLGYSNKMSKAEAFVFAQIQNLGFDFDLEVPFPKGCYKIDFAIKSILLGIELDSKLHTTVKVKERDQRKDIWLRAKGWKVVRIIIDRKTGLEEVVNQIKRELNARKEELNENCVNKRTTIRKRIPIPTSL